ncbi:ankyrin repeat protein [Seminavis robusta]|uniref:Ankyrin repeat protein n=1 Tax=Seminavis robusta TaxID=568900 RepID=A0A9N8DC30_9STRA|nr:ankyrin repeat protein [Seminavis robusta]|eukprot:Sro30_g019710.1 ankyrin repeat protein (183) ;mRNA; f:105174-105722
MPPFESTIKKSSQKNLFSAITSSQFCALPKSIELDSDCWQRILSYNDDDSYLPIALTHPVLRHEILKLNKGRKCTLSCADASYNGDLCKLQLAHHLGCPLDNLANMAAMQGNLDCLHYACEKGCSMEHDAGVAAMAALGGHVKCLRYLWENAECPFDVSVYEHGMIGGNEEVIEVLKTYDCP